MYYLNLAKFLFNSIITTKYKPCHFEGNCDRENLKISILPSQHFPKIHASCFRGISIQIKTDIECFYRMSQPAKGNNICPAVFIG